MTRYDYDSLNRLVSQTDAAQQTTRYEHDARSQVTAVVDAAGERHEFSFDALGRMTEMRRGGASATFAYDAAGNRVGRTDYNGATTTYQYDAVNRLTTISYPNSTSVTYAYDALSRLTTATNQHGTVTASYDVRSRVVSVTDVWNQRVSYEYDATGNRTQMRTAVSATTYQYDAVNRVTQLTNAGGTASFGYDAANRLTSRAMANGIVVNQQYDDLDRLTRLSHVRGGQAIADYQYQHNATNQITQIVEPTGARTFAYDAVNRLTQATHPNLPAENYAYDAVGNRTASHRSSTYTYEPVNRLTSTSSATYSYDANGNLTARTDGRGRWRYSWDYENRLTQVRRPDGLTVSYKYDGLGRRIERSTTRGERSRFSYDSQDVVLEQVSIGRLRQTLTIEQTNGLGIDEHLWQRASVGGRAVTLYYVTDHLGSTRALTDVNGNVVERVDYDSFGDGAGSNLTRYGYTGRERDADTGLYYYRARWYDAQQGRFISEDPIGLDGGVNLYAYVRNNPVNAIDPLGLHEYPGDGAINTGHSQPFIRPNIGADEGWYFRRDVWFEFFTATERARQPCRPFGQRVMQNYTETNQAIPGAAAPMGAGLITGGQMARMVDAPTLFQWQGRWFGPMNNMTQTQLLRGAAGRFVLNYAAVTTMFEGGVVVGSTISAAGCPCGY